jgi:hypothetical protein
MKSRLGLATDKSEQLAEPDKMVRLLIRYLTDENGEQRCDELLAWLDTVTVKRRLLEES